MTSVTISPTCIERARREFRRRNEPSWQPVISRALRRGDPASELIESVRQAIRAGQSLDEAIATTPLGQQYTQDIAGSDPPLVAQFAAFRAGVHRWNVWRTFQGMKEDPILSQHLTRGLALASVEV
jgi:hypothetical protein